MKFAHQFNVSFCLHDWFKVVGDSIQEALVDPKTKQGSMVFVDPMNRPNAFLVRADGIAETVIQLFMTDDGDFVIFQPSIPTEVTSYVTEPPIKTRPLNHDSDLRVLGEAIALFAAKDFVKWQGTALLESHKAAEWRCQSTAFVASLAKEPWTPEVSVSDDGTIKAAFGSVVAKVAMDKLTLTFHGKSAERLEVVRGALRDEHRRWEARRGEGEDIEPTDED
jgi:hypothetical protein